MKNLLTILTLLIFNLSVFSQHNIGAQLHFGYSSTNSSNHIVKPTFTPSGYGGLYYNYKFGVRSLVGTEILFVQIENIDRYGGVLRLCSQDEGDDFTVISSFHYSFLGLPIYYGLKLNRLTINIGAQSSLFLFGSVHHKMKITNKGKILEEGESKHPLKFKNVDLGLKTGLAFDITPKMSIEGSYYYGLNRELEIGKYYKYWQLQQLTIGIKYSFWKDAINNK